MKRIRVPMVGLMLSLAVFCVNGVAEASTVYWVEFDLDNEFGNGPDEQVVEVGEEVLCNIWLTGPGPLFGFGVIVCNYDGALEIGSVTYHLPDSWTISPVIYPPPCIDVEATDYSGTEQIEMPYMVATLSFGRPSTSAIATAYSLTFLE